MRTSFTTIFAISGLIASTLAYPATKLNARQAGLCASGTPQCCDVDVLGVADLNCDNPTTPPTSLAEFTETCAAQGKIDMCCILPILGQALLCTDASGN